MLLYATIGELVLGVWVGKIKEREIVQAVREKEISALLCSFAAFDTVDLVMEKEGESVSLARLANLSHAIACPVFCPVRTEFEDEKRLSVVVCNKGKVMDIVDRTTNVLDDEFEENDKIKIYSITEGRIAVLIDSDAFLPRNWQKVSKHSSVVISFLRGSCSIARDGVWKMAKDEEVPFVCVDEKAMEWGMGK
ncbi:MAG: hypothetical protein FWC82_02720 [Firmicutes bacterium]|nr:hypothetical protein [Bacillota bacterium]